MSIVNQNKNNNQINKQKKTNETKIKGKLNE